MSLFLISKIKQQAAKADAGKKVTVDLVKKEDAKSESKSDKSGRVLIII